MSTSQAQCHYHLTILRLEIYMGGLSQVSHSGSDVALLVCHVWLSQWEEMHNEMPNLWLACRAVVGGGCVGVEARICVGVEAL